MKVLVVDDSRIMRNIVKNSLINSNKSYEYEFKEADNGVDAFNMLQREHIDILLVDWNMPHLNGLDLVKELRALPHYEKLPIIMITSEAAKYNVIEAVKAGVNDYLVKPVIGEKLIEKIDQVLENLK